MNSYLTEEEMVALRTSKLKREPTMAIGNVKQSHLSIARFYGAATYNGADYTYFPETDELIRDDVLKFVKKLREANRPAQPALEST